MNFHMTYAIATAICLLIFIPLALVPIVLWVGTALSKKEKVRKQEPMPDIPGYSTARGGSIVRPR